MKLIISLNPQDKIAKLNRNFLVLGCWILLLIACGQHKVKTSCTSEFKDASIRRSTGSEQRNLHISGDMIFQKDQIATISAMGASHFKVATTKGWPQGIMPVQFSNDVKLFEQRAFFAACRLWSRAANVKCVSHTDEFLFMLVDKVDHFETGDCSASVGAHVNAQMHLPSAACFNLDFLLHEIGHAFGLMHEHQRPDRDQYITVNTNSAINGAVDNLQIIASGFALGEYDFLSIMHYSRYAFSKGIVDTITPKPEFMKYLNVMGRVTTLSKGDGEAMSGLYGTLSELRGETEISFRVTDAATGTSIEGATVTSISKSISVSGDGKKFKLDRGVQEFSASAHGYKTTHRSFYLSDSPTNFEIQLEEGIDEGSQCQSGNHVSE